MMMVDDCEEEEEGLVRGRAQGRAGRGARTVACRLYSASEWFAGLRCNKEGAQ